MRRNTRKLSGGPLAKPRPRCGGCAVTARGSDRNYIVRFGGAGFSGCIVGVGRVW
jgi:hypothetical protein